MTMKVGDIMRKKLETIEEPIFYSRICQEDEGQECEFFTSSRCQWQAARHSY